LEREDRKSLVLNKLFLGGWEVENQLYLHTLYNNNVHTILYIQLRLWEIAKPFLPNCFSAKWVIVQELSTFHQHIIVPVILCEVVVSAGATSDHIHKGVLRPL
jgi:hypothetical protein